MGLTFSYAGATQIIFGKNSLEKVPGLVADTGGPILLLTGKNTEKARSFSKLFPIPIEVLFFSIPSEPDITLINQGVELAREKNCKVIIGLGGGSVIDGAKAIAALVPNRGEVMDYLEVIGKGKALEKTPLPFIAIPTTSGTGAEVTKNAVIKSLEHKVKVSLRSDKMYPDYAVVDPELTVSMPPELTAQSGVDALTHLLETFVSNQSNSFIDMYCREGLKRVSRSLLKACKNGNNLEARTDMAMASMLGGIALANVKLGAIHGFAGPMGGMYPIPHGAICACLMSATVEMNIQALQKQNKAVSKFTELAVILTGNRQAVAGDAVIWLQKLLGDLTIPSLSQFDLSKKDFPELVEKAKNSSSMKGNPVKLSDEQLTWILKKSM